MQQPLPASEVFYPQQPVNQSYLLQKSLSVILPAHNEEQIIAQTVHIVTAALTPWVEDFEVIVINDGSSDQTATVLAALALTEPRLRSITHEVNKGYGAALVTGFEASAKDLAFFMDSDGQFDINDIAFFFPLVEQYDAVLGYRLDRQDTAMRKFNAWGWKMLVRLLLGVRVRDIDCAFKLYSGEFIRRHHFETRGAMINSEMLYKLNYDGCSYIEIGVHHLPRVSGKATGAKLSVILRAFRELFQYAYRWRILNQE